MSTPTYTKEQRKKKREKLMLMIADYIWSAGDHNTREVSERLMLLADDFYFYLNEFHQEFRQDD